MAEAVKSAMVGAKASKSGVILQLYLEGIGKSPDELFRSVLSSDSGGVASERRPNGRADIDSQLWDAAESITNDRLLGLNVANAMTSAVVETHFDVFYFAFMSSTCLRDALANTHTYLSILSANVRCNVSDEKNGIDVARVSFLAANGGPLQRQAAMFLLASVANTARFVLGVGASPHASTLPIPSSYESEAVSRCFGTRITFGGNEAAVEFDARLVQSPMKSENSRLKAVLERYVSMISSETNSPPTSLVLKVREAIMASIGSPEVSAAAIAEKLETSERSLQRHLQGAGISFLAIRDDVFEKVAKHYLRRQRFSVGEIACLLGYSEESAFHRAFKRWTGMTPTEYRDRGELRQK